MDVKLTLETSFREEWLRLIDYNDDRTRERQLSQLSVNIADAIPLEQLNLEINRDIDTFVGNRKEREDFHERNLRVLGIFYAMILIDLARRENPTQNNALYLNSSTYKDAYDQLREDLLLFIKIYPCVKPRPY